MPSLANPLYWYIGSTKWSAVTQWSASTAKTVSALLRQQGTPTEGDERVFVCIQAGTTKSGGQPTWNITKGAKTTDGSVIWQECTGQPTVNGDVTHTQDWNNAKSNTITLGQIIKDVAGTFYFICTTAGNSGSGSEPSWNTTPGAATADSSVTWTCIGSVGSFSAWGAPHARLTKALATGWGNLAGATYYVSNNHAESSPAAGSITFTGTSTAPNYCLCVDDSAAPPTATATTASITYPSTSLALSGVAAYCYVYGISFSSNSTLTAGVLIAQYENCSFHANTSGISLSGNSLAKSIFRNCAFSFGNSSAVMGGNEGTVEIIGGSIAATGTVPTAVLISNSNISGNMIVRDCDISGVTTTLVDISKGTDYHYIFANCQLGSGVTLTTGTIAGPGNNTLRVHNCDSGATNYRMFTQYYTGTSQHDTGVYNDDGATDGTTPISWKIITNSKPFFWQPFVSEQIFQWVDTTGSPLTATVEIAGSATLNDDDTWMELEYLGSSSAPLGSTVDCRKATLLSSATAVPSSSASWTGSPAVRQKLQVTFTPEMKGPVKARIYVAKPSITVYVDPLITVA